MKPCFTRVTFAFGLDNTGYPTRAQPHLKAPPGPRSAHRQHPALLLPSATSVGSGSWSGTEHAESTAAALRPLRSDHLR